MKRSSRLRTWFQAAWFVLTNGYVRGYTSGQIFTGPSKVLCVPGLNCYSCPGALASCPVGSLQAVLNKGGFRVSLYVFGLMSMFGVLFGRLVCGWMCPFGLVQDLLHKIKVGGKRKNLPGHRYLRYVRYAVLAIMVLLLPALVIGESGLGQPWFCEWICPSGTLFGGIPLVLLNEGFQKAIGLRFAWKVALLVLICVGAVFYYRPFCKYLCPLGALYGLFNPVSTYRLEVDADKCTSCRACQRACGMDIATFTTPNSTDCIRCGDCISACPTGALSSTWNRAGQRMANRCFIDDETAAAVASSSNPELVSTTVLGVLMVAGGLFASVWGAFVNLFLDFDSRFNIDSLAAMGPASLITGTLKVVAGFIVLLTGIYTLRHRNELQRIEGVSEKVGLAERLYLVGVAVFVVGTILDVNTFSSSLTAIVVNFYCLVCLPLVWACAAALKRQLETRDARARLSVMLLLVGIATTAYVALALYNLPSVISSMMVQV